MLINLNKHEITVQVGDEVKAFPPSGTVVTVKVTQEVVGDVEGVPVKQNTYGEVVGLPAPQEGVVYIVNALVLAALDGSRPDCVAPDTGPTAIRFPKGDPREGQVKAVTAFTR